MFVCPMKPTNTEEGRGEVEYEWRENCPCTAKKKTEEARCLHRPRHSLRLVGAAASSFRVRTRMLTECCNSPVGLPAAPIDVIADCPPAAAAVAAAAAAAAAAAVLACPNMPGVVLLMPLKGERKMTRVPTALTRRGPGGRRVGREVLKGLSSRKVWWSSLRLFQLRGLSGTGSE